MSKVKYTRAPTSSTMTKSAHFTAEAIEAKVLHDAYEELIRSESEHAKAIYGTTGDIGKVKKMWEKYFVEHICANVAKSAIQGAFERQFSIMRASVRYRNIENLEKNIGSWFETEILGVKNTSSTPYADLSEKQLMKNAAFKEFLATQRRGLGGLEAKTTTNVLRDNLKVGDVTFKSSQNFANDQDNLMEKIAVMKIIDKMRNFIYLVLQKEGSTSGLLRFEQLWLYAGLIVDKFVGDALRELGKSGSLFTVNYTHTEESDKNGEIFYMNKVTIHMRKNLFSNVNELLEGHISNYYRIKTDLLNIIRTNDDVRRKFFGVVESLDFFEVKGEM